MNQSNSTTNVILILVVVVGFGVWYFAYRSPADNSSDAGINIELDGGSDGTDATY